MRVLHLTRDLLPRSNGGISTAVAGQTAALRRAGVEVAVVSFDAWRPRRTDAAPAAPAPEPSPAGPVLRLTHPRHLDRGAAFTRAFGPDLVHVHADLLWEYTHAWAPETPRVLSIHVLQAVQDALRGLDAPTRSTHAQAEALAQADAVACPSQAVLGALLGSQPSLGPRLHLVPLGVDVPASPPGPRADGPLLSLGRFADIKGTAELLEAFARLLHTHPAARLTVAGGLPDNPRAEAGWRASWARLAPPGHEAQFDFAGWVPHDAVGAFFARGAAVVIPSWFETFGQVALEASAHGLPVVACAAGALPELIADGVTGLLVPPRDPRALAAALSRLLDDPPLAARLGAAGSIRARSHTHDAATPALVRLYTAAFTRASARP